jgi:hypothetical protein
MATNRDLLKEAIADAKAVKETAIANAKAALEEAFTPQLKSMLSMKLQEMESEEEEIMKEDGFGDFDTKENTTFNTMGKKALDEEDDDMNDEIDLEALLAELNEEEEEMEEPINEAEEEAEEAEESEESEESEEEGEPIDLEDMTDEDLKSMIEDVIKDMIETGELEAGHEGEEGEEEAEEEGEEEIESEEEEIDLAELLREIENMEEDKEPMYESGEELEELFGRKSVGSSYLKKFEAENQSEVDRIKSIESEDQRRKAANDLIKKWIRYATQNEYEYRFDIGVLFNDLGLKDVRGGKTANTTSIAREGMEEELEEAYSTIETLKSELNEINLLNAKLLYTNKIFKAKNLNESQKVKVLSSFDKASNVGEVKMVFETLNEGIKVSKNPIKEHLGGASKSTLTPNIKKPIVESNEAYLRMQKLAGII